MENELLANIDRLHTTELGSFRVKRNLNLDVEDIVSWSAKKCGEATEIIKKGKNYYVYVDNIIITLNAHSFTIITAHRRKGQ